MHFPPRINKQTNKQTNKTQEASLPHTCKEDGFPHALFKKYLLCGSKENITFLGKIYVSKHSFLPTLQHTHLQNHCKSYLTASPSFITNGEDIFLCKSIYEVLGENMGELFL